MTIPYEQLENELKRVLLKLGFTPVKAELCASVFSGNSRDGVYSHGLNRFPVFVKDVKEGLINIDAEPAPVAFNGLVETWDGNFGVGIYNASVAMSKAIEKAKTSGIGCVALKNTNHWMRGGTYGWQAADAGCISICFTNTIANMPPWGGKEPRLGNNPLVIAVPRAKGHIVLDMAMSQYSYGKLQEHELNKKELAVPGGFDEEGNLTTNPSAIQTSLRALPVGFWKGSGLSFILDVLLTAITGGNTVGKITANGKEVGISQFFLCIYQNNYHDQLIEEIIAYTRSSAPSTPGERIFYPGEKTLATRHQSELEGVFVDERIWSEVLAL